MTADLGQIFFSDFDLVHIKWGFSLLVLFCFRVNLGSTDPHPVSNLPERIHNSAAVRSEQNIYWLLLLVHIAVSDNDLSCNSTYLAHHYLCTDLYVLGFFFLSALRLIINCV